MKQVEHTNNEQHMLEAVQHPFIINLWGTFQDAANLYMVMDFVPGGELFTLLRRSNVSTIESRISLSLLTLRSRGSLTPSLNFTLPKSLWLSIIYIVLTSSIVT
jgi:serine/threonine protein kinase